MTAEQSGGAPDGLRATNARAQDASTSRDLESSFRATDFTAGDIVWVVVPRLDTAGHEQWGDRPWVIISSATLHDRDLGVVIAVPCTSQNKQETFRAARIRVPLEAIDVVNLRAEDQLVLTEHVRSISVQRIRKRAGRIKDNKVVNLIRGAVATLVDI